MTLTESIFILHISNIKYLGCLGVESWGKKDDRYVGGLQSACVGRWISWSFYSCLNIY